MSKTRITTKGQITVPKKVRDRMGLRTGDELEFIEEDGIYRIKKYLPPTPLKKYRGYLKELNGHDPDRVVERCGRNDHGCRHKYPFGYPYP
jgi:AbrB family looped-hinge helix DNA binding protein